MTTERLLSVMSWNINGGVLDKLPALEKLCESYSVICLQEHFLTDMNSQLLCLSSSVTVHLSPAKRLKAKGRPSGGLAVLTTCQSGLLEMCDCYLAITVDDLIIVNLYLPSNYRDVASEMLLLAEK
jgi:exonuclease III